MSQRFPLVRSHAGSRDVGTLFARSNASSDLSRSCGIITLSNGPKISSGPWQKLQFPRSRKNRFVEIGPLVCRYWLPTANADPLAFTQLLDDATLVEDCKLKPPKANSQESTASLPAC